MLNFREPERGAEWKNKFGKALDFLINISYLDGR